MFELKTEKVFMKREFKVILDKKAKVNALNLRTHCPTRSKS